MPDATQSAADSREGNPDLKRLLILVGLLCILGFAGFQVLTAPFTWDVLHPKRDVADAGAPDLVNGRSLFYAGSCGTCHASPGQKDDTRLGGGAALTSNFGTFYMPNISPDRTDGIGGWTTAQFVRAMREGVDDGGENLYPALPYTSYQRMTANDLRDLFGYIQTLPPIAGKARDNDLKFRSPSVAALAYGSSSSSTGSHSLYRQAKVRPGRAGNISWRVRVTAPSAIHRVIR
jgi:mono/diheme cytochrome c family protein